MSLKRHLQIKRLHGDIFLSPASHNKALKEYKESVMVEERLIAQMDAYDAKHEDYWSARRHALQSDFEQNQKAIMDAVKTLHNAGTSMTYLLKLETKYRKEFGKQAKDAVNNEAISNPNSEKGNYGDDFADPHQYKKSIGPKAKKSHSKKSKSYGDTMNEPRDNRGRWTT